MGTVHPWLSPCRSRDLIVDTEIALFPGGGGWLHATRELHPGLKDAEFLPIARRIEQDMVRSLRGSRPRIPDPRPLYPGTTVGLKVRPVTYHFAIEMCGAWLHHTSEEIDRILKHKGRRTDALITLTMPRNDPEVGGWPAPPADEHARTEADRTVHLGAVAEVAHDRRSGRGR